MEPYRILFSQCSSVIEGLMFVISQFQKTVSQYDIFTIVVLVIIIVISITCISMLLLPSRFRFSKFWKYWCCVDSYFQEHILQVRTELIESAIAFRQIKVEIRVARSRAQDWKKLQLLHFLSTLINYNSYKSLGILQVHLNKLFIILFFRIYLFHFLNYTFRELYKTSF